MSPEQFKKSVLKIASYLNQDFFINKLMEFDANCFLDVASRLFYGEAFWFIDKVRTRTQTEGGRSTSPKALLAHIQEIVEKKQNSYVKQLQREIEEQLILPDGIKDVQLSKQEDSQIMQAFLNFILTVFIQHKKCIRKMKQEQSNNNKVQTNFFICQEWDTINELNIEYDMIIRALKRGIQNLGKIIGDFAREE